MGAFVCAFSDTEPLEAAGMFTSPLGAPGSPAGSDDMSGNKS